MHDHCCHHDISKSKGVVIKNFSQVESINGSEELLFYFSLDSGSNGEFLNDGMV